MHNIILLSPEARFNRTIARMPGVKAAVAAKADAIASTAAALHARHFYSGHSNVGVRHRFQGRYGRIDSMVDLNDKGGNALAIEFGHFHNFTGEYIPGKYSLWTAVMIHAI